ncbi:anaerobic ribonucleoside-triphosphate reductase activating protein [Desulfovibrio sp. X2]|uniref:anaerobic ribonucleoside-triphosphate reductase activating protein n=1 Tax=Desulfovibrio sp. X2 TaxID=941449 RepID=UPI00040D7FBE|nr:anaerobic ribonucleoside-triphosphate reductase activating protein [Desulfovibrio sp. X2]
MFDIPADAWGHLRGIQPLSLCDWPGRPCAVLFLGGCNLRCPTCHNFGLAWEPETLPVLYKPDVLNFLSRRAGWLEGVTVSGGEPTAVPHLADFLRDIRAAGMPVKLDSNGMRPEIIAEVLAAGLVEEVHVDVKGPWAKYPALTGRHATAEEAEERLSRIFDLARSRPGVFTFRCTRVPLLDDDDIAAVRACLPAGHVLTINAYVPPRRSHAQPDPEKRRVPGDVVHGPHRERHPQGPEGQRDQGPASRQAPRP